jgi:hypothetical protein
MTDVFQEMLSFMIENEIGFSKDRATKLAAYFNDINEFKNVTQDQLMQLQTASGRIAFHFSLDDLTKILEFARSEKIDSSLSISQNFLASLCRSFTKTQLEKITKINLENIIPNPFLIKSLNLHSPHECIAFNVYAHATRSIVTSMGYYMEKFLIASSSSVEKGLKPWDLLKTKEDGSKHWIQVKSGPNDMDKDQVDTWSRYILQKIESGDKAYIGISYGKRSDVTVSLNMFKGYLPNYQERILVGRELWDFVTDDHRYLEILFQTMTESARTILGTRSFSEEIDMCIDRNVQAFIEKYGDGEVGVNNYITDIF